ncbi:MAG: serine/threonine protein kinase, partial [Deltaproteobacteria bacterium]|nr:serine/threonine protein kinase [Deltaproteobacteria bacterium]
MKKPIPFGKYLLLERINVGGMAEVFKAKAFGVEGFERLVAVKRILPSIAEDQEFITMFVDEAKIAVQLTHANIAQIFDLGRVGDSYFIAMEFVHGKDLRAIFDRARKRGETVPVPMACYVAMKVCEGLDYAHNKKDAAGRDLHLVHRDVSPQNVLLSYDGEVKVIDFGIAKAAGKAGKTQAGILKGKFGYMSPEQVRGLPLDRRSDIFAVGIVLYELLTGERLFVGESDFSTLEKVKNVEIMPPSTYNRRIPEELEQIVLKALAKDVDDRYQTAMDLHDDLQSFMYTSGNFFSRKDLSAYQRKAFAEEIAKESAREEEYRRMEADLARPGGGNVASGLDQFDDIEPLEPSVNVPDPRPTAAPQKAAQPLAAAMAAPPPPQRSPGPPPPRNTKKPTLMGGMGAAVPPPPPRVSAAPPPPPP